MHFPKLPNSAWESPLTEIGIANTHKGKCGSVHSLLHMPAFAILSEPASVAGISIMAIDLNSIRVGKNTQQVLYWAYITVNKWRLIGSCPPPHSRVACPFPTHLSSKKENHKLCTAFNTAVGRRSTARDASDNNAYHDNECAVTMTAYFHRPRTPTPSHILTLNLFPFDILLEQF